MMKIFRFTIITSFIWGASVLPAFAIGIKQDFPKLANYYLQPLVPKRDYEGLAKFDIVILDVDTQTIDPSLFTTLKEKNPDIMTFAYIPSQSVNVQDLSSWARFRNITYSDMEKKNGWLRDQNGKYVYFSSVWPTIRFVDIGNGWSDYLSGLAKDDVIARGMWDGIFYDMVFAQASWVNGGNLDFNKDGIKDSSAVVDAYWRKSTIDLLEKTKKKIAPKKLIANIDQIEKYDTMIDGVMMENFPSPWIGANPWSKLQNRYQNTLSNGGNKIVILNSNMDNGKKTDEYRQMRFGLSSTLLGDGYFSFDSGDQNHAQTWWYDEYDVRLGKAKSRAYNLLDRNNPAVKAGVWRRDFEYGIAVVNSTDKVQKYVFSKEEFDKLSGTQDLRINNGSKINYLKLDPQDGLILLKSGADIIDTSFNNGSFVRAFSNAGTQVKNGFFAYKDAYPGDTQVLISDVENDKTTETIVNGKGMLTVYDDGLKKSAFYPFGKNFKNKISFAAGDLNNDGSKEIIAGPAEKGSPQIVIYSAQGKCLSGGFYAFDRSIRGGVSIASGDVNDDGRDEIIVAGGAGIAPIVKIFDKNGRMLSSFMAYDKHFLGGVSVAVGDVNNDGKKEIITGPGAGSVPNVKIFDRAGKLLGQFFAYEKEMKSGISVMAADINNDSIDEILASTNNVDKK